MDLNDSTRLFGLTDNQFLDEVLNSPVTTTPLATTEPAPAPVTTGTVKISAKQRKEMDQQDKHDRQNVEAYQALLDADGIDQSAQRPTGRPRGPDWAKSRLKQQKDRVQKEKVLAIRTARLKNVRILERMVDRMRFIAPRQGGHQRGAISRSAAKSGDSNSSDDGAGDPDPADVLIADSWSAINTHKASQPINRIVRKAILAHRAGMHEEEKRNLRALRVYNWYVDRALGEIRRAMHSLVTSWDGAQSSAHSLVSACAVRFFYHMCLPPKPKGAPKNASGGHDFDQRPNPVVTDLVTNSAFRNVGDLRKYARTGMFQDGLNKDRAAHEGKVFEEVMEMREQADFGFWDPRGSAIEPSGDFYQGVKIKHLEPGLTVDKAKDTKEKDTKAKSPKAKAPKDAPHTYSVKPISAKSVSYPVVTATLEKDGSEDDFHEEDLYEPDFQPEVLPEKDAVEVKKAGDMARQTIQYILNQPDRQQALIDAAMALSELGDDRVLDALSRDKANAGLAAEILALVGYQPAQSKLSEKERKRQLKIQVEDLLENLGRRQTPEYILSNRTDILSFLKDYTDSERLSNVKSNLETIAKNLRGRFSPEIQRAASILFSGGEA